VPPFEELTESNAKLLNEMACIVLFTGKFYLEQDIWAPPFGHIDTWVSLFGHQATVVTRV